IQVGLIGVGQMGTDILAQIDQMQGMQTSVVIDIEVNRVVEALNAAGCKAEIAVVKSVEEAHKAISEGKTAISDNWHIATQVPDVQAIIDSTGSPVIGTEIAVDCCEHKKHIIMMNVECDITVGPILKKLADKAGVIYSMGAGDEPAALMELYRFADSLGMEVVAAGKGKNNPLDVFSNPDALAAKAKDRNMSPYMLCEFVDGSKTAIEMASVSNATGLVPDVSGMHGPKATRDTIHQVFCPKSEGGVLNNKGVVEYAIGVHPGVFLVVTTDNPRLREALIQRDMGNGPYYQLFRPYHLCSIEVPLSVAQVVIYGESSGHPGQKLVSECVAVAKRNLKAGETLDGIGGFCYRVSIEKAEEAQSNKMVPAGLIKGAVLAKDVSQGTVIDYSMLESIPDNALSRMRKRMDEENQ
ncbi:MAG: NAD(P)-dependent oxidoreductase, partial [Fibrobacteria bacterium]|nr:NAD(P)-dependent oxidoreductase [Fibrobacteria bacterium]